MNLVLGPGFAPGLAALGVLDEMRRRRISPTRVIGANTGALAGALWAVGSDLALASRVIAHLPWRAYVVAQPLAQADPLLQAFDLLLQGATFAALDRPVSVLLRAGDAPAATQITSGSLAAAVRGAFAIPGLFHPIDAATAWQDAGAGWAQAARAALKPSSAPTLWVVPSPGAVVSPAPDFDPSLHALAGYIAHNWLPPEPGAGEALLRIEAPPHAALSFAHAPDWMAAGREAAGRWLDGKGA